MLDDTVDGFEQHCFVPRLQRNELLNLSDYLGCSCFSIGDEKYTNGHEKDNQREERKKGIVGEGSGTLFSVDFTIFLEGLTEPHRERCKSSLAQVKDMLPEWLVLFH